MKQITYLDKLMENEEFREKFEEEYRSITILDIWLSKLNYGWSLDDVPNKEIREAIIDILQT
uniref:Uncharacterized protein n=1 Tax=viral metagenome TaxID=1070528 RepID=A0A6M3L0R7_9ZZZZ